MAWRTFFSVSVLVIVPLITRETEAIDTPACLATAPIVANALCSFSSVTVIVYSYSGKITPFIAFTTGFFGNEFITLINS